jgi:hypothetical protein
MSRESNEQASYGKEFHGKKLSIKEPHKDTCQTCDKHNSQLGIIEENNKTGKKIRCPPERTGISLHGENNSLF